MPKLRVSAKFLVFFYFLMCLFLLPTQVIFANTNTLVASLSNFVYFQDGMRLRTDIYQTIDIPFSSTIDLSTGIGFGISTQPGLTNYPGNLFHLNMNSQFRYHFGSIDNNHFFAALNAEAGWVSMPIPGTLTLYDWLPRFELGAGMGYALRTFNFSVKDILIRVYLEPFILIGRSFYLYTDAKTTSLLSANRLGFRIRLSFHHELKKVSKPAHNNDSDQKLTNQTPTSH